MVESVKRLVAEKVCIGDMLQGKYIKEDGWNPNYINIKGKKVSRVNVIAVVLSKQNDPGANYSYFVLDDGTGSISVRSFEEKEKKNDKLEVGDVVFLIGRLREFGSERYIIPEIVRKVENKDWIKLRKMELSIGDSTGEESYEKVEAPAEEEVLVESSSQIVCRLIKELDKGNGVDFGSVLKNSKFKNTEEIISSLLQEGEIFELKPGILKVLE